MLKKGMKIRPHDAAFMIEKFKPQVVEIHASSEDLEKKIEGKWDVQLAVHLPEYDGSDLMDPADKDERKRLRAENFYNKAISKAREWAENFRGTPKVIIHPGGWSPDPINPYEKDFLYGNFSRTAEGLNKTGVNFCIENMPPLPYYYGGTWHSNIFMDPRETRDYCLGNGWGLCLDVVHLYMYCNYVKELDFMKSIRQLRPVVSHIHVSGAEGTNGEGLPMREGSLPVREVIEYFKNLQVALVSERWQGHHDGGAGFEEDWEFINEILKDGSKP